MSGRDVGAMGEATFKRWCSSVGFTANGSQMDKTGWDFLVEFPWQQDERLPKDLLPAPVECRVQIKSTDKKQKGVSVKLSALNRLVKAPMPTFFCFIEFDGQDQEQAAYLVHIGKEIIEEALKKTRELEAQGKGGKLNKSKMFISYRKEHQLEKANGESLKRSIEQYIPNGLEKYVEAKIKLLATLGFEQGVALVTITFSADSMEKLVDSALGIGEAVFIEKSVGYNSRFDILLSEPFVESDEALISLQAKPVKAVLRFKEYTFSPEITFDAELLRSPFDQIFPEEFAKARVKSKFFDFIFQPKNKIKFSCHMESDGAKYPLNEIRDYLKVVSMLQSSSDSLIVEIGWGDKDVPRTYQFQLKGQLEDRQLAIAYELSVTLSSLLPVFHLADHQFFLSFSELLSASEIIQMLHHYCLNQNLKGEMIEVVGEVESASNRTAMIGFVQAEIGGYTFGICLGILGALTLINEQSYMLVAERCLVYAPVVAEENRAIEPAVIAEKLSRFAQRLGQEQFAVMTTAFT